MATFFSTNTAEARVVASSRAYFGLERNVTSPAWASSMPATSMDFNLRVAFERAAQASGQVAEFHIAISLMELIGRLKHARTMDRSLYLFQICKSQI